VHGTPTARVVRADIDEVQHQILDADTWRRATWTGVLLAREFAPESPRAPVPAAHRMVDVYQDHIRRFVAQSV
jgi:hypothetical protein